MITSAQITEIYFIVDCFSQEFDTTMGGHSIKKSTTKTYKQREFVLSDSEVITILLLFHLGSYRNLKHFYVNHVQKYLASEFPKTVSYNRFVELQSKVIMKLAIFVKTYCLGNCTGISFIDSTPLRACHIKRERQNKVFKTLATKGQCSVGWFYGFKLHLIINDKGEILEFMLTQGNVDDREPLKNKSFHDKIFGKLFGDKGYISSSLFEELFIDGIHLITKIKKNMKNCLMHIHDKIALRKRSLIETVNDELKNMCQIEHTRHRSFNNFLTNLLSGLAAYSFFPKKPSINIEFADNRIIG